MIFGVLYLATFVFSIAGVLLYTPVLHPAKFTAGAGGDTRVRLGAVCEVFLIIANIGTALVVYPIFRRQFEVLSLGYVTARLMECTFIAIGIVSYLAVVTLRHQAGRDRRFAGQRRESAGCGSQLEAHSSDRRTT